MAPNPALRYTRSGPFVLLVGAQSYRSYLRVFFLSSEYYDQDVLVNRRIYYLPVAWGKLINQKELFRLCSPGRRIL